jgi:hypothetical protein
MADNSLINNTETPDDTIEIDPNKNYFEELVGDGKKFKDQEALAKSKFHADQTIELYKRRMDEQREDILNLRKEMNTKANLEDLLKKLDQSSASREITQSNENIQKPLQDDEETFYNRIQSYERKKKADENFNTVKNKLTEQFGENYSAVLKQRSTELGLPIEDIDALARKSPTAFFRTLGLDQQPQQETFTTPPRSQQRRDNFAPSGRKERTWSYYQELKAKDPMLYYNPKIAVQMQQDAIELGEAFRDGDYYKPGLHDR